MSDTVTNSALLPATDAAVRPLPAVRRTGLRQALRAEAIKLRTVRSTTWTLASLVVLGVGLTVIVCATSAEWLASAEADETSGSFVTWGMGLAQLSALVLGTIAVTSEYARGMIATTVAAVPRRVTVIAAKAVVLSAVLLVVGTLTAFAGYFGGNPFLDAEGVGLALSDDGVLRAMFGSGLYLAVLGLFGAALGLLLRHTAAAVTFGIALVFVVGNLVVLVPGATGEWLTRLMPGNAGSSIATVTPFNPDLLGPWTGFAVFCAETALLLGIATVRFVRRDA